MVLTFQGHDVIGHVTIRFPMGHFLFASSDSRSFLADRTNGRSHFFRQRRPL